MDDCFSSKTEICRRQTDSALRYRRPRSLNTKFAACSIGSHHEGLNRYFWLQCIIIEKCKSKKSNLVDGRTKKIYDKPNFTFHTCRILCVTERLFHFVLIKSPEPIGIKKFRISAKKAIHQSADSHIIFWNTFNWGRVKQSKKFYKVLFMRHVNRGEHYFLKETTAIIVAIAFPKKSN